MLVEGEYDKIEKLTGGIRLSADDIDLAIKQYGRNLIIPPRESYDAIDAILVLDTTPPQWSVRFTLWTREEGSSDLTLELTLIQADKGCRIELDDIHVL